MVNRYPHFYRNYYQLDFALMINGELGLGIREEKKSKSKDEGLGIRPFDMLRVAGIRDFVSSIKERAWHDGF
jgi:hypothetical protein